MKSKLFCLITIIFFTTDLVAKDLDLQWGSNSCYVEAAMHALSHVNSMNLALRKIFEKKIVNKHEGTMSLLDKNIDQINKNKKLKAKFDYIREDIVLLYSRLVDKIHYKIGIDKNKFVFQLTDEIEIGTGITWGDFYWVLASDKTVNHREAGDFGDPMDVIYFFVDQINTVLKEKKLAVNLFFSGVPSLNKKSANPGFCELGDFGVGGKFILSSIMGPDVLYVNLQSNSARPIKFKLKNNQVVERLRASMGYVSYELSAIVHNPGGHTWSYVRDDFNEWYKYDNYTRRWAGPEGTDAGPESIETSVIEKMVLADADKKQNTLFYRIKNISTSQLEPVDLTGKVGMQRVPKLEFVDLTGDTFSQKISTLAISLQQLKKGLGSLDARMSTLKGLLKSKFESTQKSFPTKNTDLKWGGMSCWFDSAIHALSYLDEMDDMLKEQFKKPPEKIFKPGVMTPEKEAYIKDNFLRLYIKLVEKIHGKFDNQPLFAKTDEIEGGITLDEFHKKTEKWLWGTEGDFQDPYDLIRSLLNAVNVHSCHSIGFITKTVCENGHFIVSRLQQEKILHLPIKSNEPLQSLIANKLRSDFRLKGFICDSCGDVVNAKRISTLVSIPIYLFSRIGTKEIALKNPFSFELTLQNDLFDESVQDIVKNKQVKYNLVAVIFYTGSHYWAIAKAGNGTDFDTWYRYNELSYHKVTTLNKQEMLQIAQAGKDGGGKALIFIYQIDDESKPIKVALDKFDAAHVKP